ncbi:MAG: alpha/beta hydrolase [Lachnospiraceae bacterium]|nr:alpha/beta hydrolase [Lachnospiraceae bacterium]
MDLKWEDRAELKPPGVVVTVNNHKMHIYKRGDGADTVVLMAGGGTCCPVIDFKPLWKPLSQKFTVAVIEKAGYGWSESANVSRDIDTILYETRTALNLANLSPPYILMPHSMSGLEALAWSAYFPNEIQAIIGLDAATPACYDHLTTLKVTVMTLLYRALSIGAHIGLPRLMAGSAEKTIRDCGQFSEKEISIYRHMFIHNSFTKNMVEEVKCCRNNAQKVKNLGYPYKTPYLSFVSNGKEIGISNWRELLMGFVSNMQYGKYVTLNCGHYIHYYHPQTIIHEIEEFIFDIRKS